MKIHVHKDSADGGRNKRNNFFIRVIDVNTEIDFPPMFFIPFSW